MYTCIFCRKQINLFQQKYDGQFCKQRQRLGPVQSASQPQLSVAQARTRRGSQSQRRYFSPRPCWPLPPHQLAPCSSSSPQGLSQFPSESSWTPAGRSASLFTSSAQLPSAQARQVCCPIKELAQAHTGASFGYWEAMQIMRCDLFQLKAM